MNKKNVFLWTLYDFANSIVTIVFFLYFAQWLVIDHGVSDLWYNMIFVGSSILLVLTSPIYGAVADQNGKRFKYLRVTTLLMFLLFVIMGLIANFSPQLYIYAAIAYLLGNYIYQFSFSFYNPMLHDIAPAKSQGLVSGIGQSANWTGQIFGLLVTLPLAGGAIYLFGSHGRAQTFLPATLLFMLLSLPMLLFFKDPAKSNTAKIKISPIAEYKKLIVSFRKLIKYPGIGTFLLGYFFFNDAVITASNNFPIYMEQVFKISDRVKSFVLIGILVTAAIGAFVSGWVGDKLGLKRTLIAILIGWVIVFPLLSSLTDLNYFIVATMLMGFLYGSVWTISRAVMSYLSPPSQLNYAFSFYTLAERFATFIGPLSWGLVTYFLINLGPFRYRLALMLMGGFVLIGLLIARKIPNQQEIVAL